MKDELLTEVIKDIEILDRGQCYYSARNDTIYIVLETRKNIVYSESKVKRYNNIDIDSFPITIKNDSMYVETSCGTYIVVDLYNNKIDLGLVMGDFLIIND